MKSSKSPEGFTVVYARFYSSKTLKALYKLAMTTDKPLTELVEQACAFAFSHPDFKVAPREGGLIDRTLEARQRRAEKFKRLAGL